MQRIREILEQGISNYVTNTTFVNKFRTISLRKKLIGTGIAILTISTVFIGVNSFGKLSLASMETEHEPTFSVIPIAATSAKTDVISIPAGVVKANPFVPYKNYDGDMSHDSLVMDVPAYDLVAPPDFSESSSEKARIMETAVSGILFDKFSPSAILKIDGNDYLVKKGDVIQNYKVVNIARDSVTVQSGKNTYKAGIGEIITEGSINYNEVSNLNKKFGGEQR